MSFQITVAPKRKAAIRLISSVRHSLMETFEREAEQNGLNQADIARRLDVNRSVISRVLSGGRDFTIGTIAELAWAMGYLVKITLQKRSEANPSNNISTHSNITNIKPSHPIMTSTKITGDTTGSLSSIKFDYATTSNQRNKILDECQL